VAGRLLIEVDGEMGSDGDVHSGTVPEPVLEMPRNGTAKRCVTVRPRIPEVDLERARIVLELERDELERRRHQARRSAMLNDAVELAALLDRNARLTLSDAEARDLQDALALEVTVRGVDTPVRLPEVAATIQRVLAEQPPSPASETHLAPLQVSDLRTLRFVTEAEFFAYCRQNGLTPHRV